MIAKLFSDLFKSKFKHILKTYMGDILGLHKSKIIFYYLNGKSYSDVRRVFKQTSEADDTLIKYYKPFWDLGTSKWNKIKRVADAVNGRLTYTSDIDNPHYKRFEYWATPIEVHNNEKDDCDGYAVLLCYVLRLLGLGEYDVFVRVGRVKYTNGKLGEKHANVLVRDEDSMLFFPIEGSWYPNLTSFEFSTHKLPFHRHPRYTETEWITNDKFSFANTRWFKWIK